MIMNRVCILKDIDANAIMYVVKDTDNVYKLYILLNNKPTTITTGDAKTLINCIRGYKGIEASSLRVHLKRFLEIADGDLFNKPILLEQYKPKSRKYVCKHCSEVSEYYEKKWLQQDNCGRIEFVCILCGNRRVEYDPMKVIYKPPRDYTKYVVDPTNTINALRTLVKHNKQFGLIEQELSDKEWWAGVHENQGRKDKKYFDMVKEQAQERKARKENQMITKEKEEGIEHLLMFGLRLYPSEVDNSNTSKKKKKRKRKSKPNPLRLSSELKDIFGGI